MACGARAARGSIAIILHFLLIRNAAEELNKFHYNYVDFNYIIFLRADRGVRPYTSNMNFIQFIKAGRRAFRSCSNVCEITNPLYL